MYKTPLQASQPIVNQRIFPAILLCDCSCLLVFHCWITRYATLTNTLVLHHSIVSNLDTLIVYEHAGLASILNLYIQYARRLPLTSLWLLLMAQALLLLPFLLLSLNLPLHLHTRLITWNESLVPLTTCYAAIKSPTNSTSRISTSTAVDRLLSPLILPYMLHGPALITQPEQPSSVSFPKMSHTHTVMPQQYKTHGKQ